MIAKKNFVAALKDSAPLIGTIISIRSPEVAEALSMMDFDWLFVDLEHSMIDIPAAQSILQAVANRVYTALRLPGNTPEHFKKALDTGCDAVVVPLITSADEAREAVRAAKYPPRGERSIGVGRAHSYGLAFASYVETANDSVGLIVQVEHERAVSEIDKILAVEGIDAIFVGPYDLSGSMGLIGQVDHAAVVAAIEKVRSACTKTGMPFGIFCGEVARAGIEAGQGTKLIAFATDLMLLTKSALACLAELRNADRNL